MRGGVRQDEKDSGRVEWMKADLRSTHLLLGTGQRRRQVLTPTRPTAAHPTVLSRVQVALFTHTVARVIWDEEKEGGGCVKKREEDV